VLCQGRVLRGGTSRRVSRACRGVRLCGWAAPGRASRAAAPVTPGGRVSAAPSARPEWARGSVLQVSKAGRMAPGERKGAGGAKGTACR
jgi:hypothetical protein